MWEISSGVQLLVFAVLLTSACSGDAVEASRRVEPVAWDTAFIIGGRLNDTTLIRPWLLTTGSAGVFTYDYGSASVKAFDTNGLLRWTHGRRGSGPGEFRNPIDIKVDAHGFLWVLDAGAGRLAVLDTTGAEHQLLPLRDSPQQVVLLDTMALVVLYSLDNRLAVSLGKDGALTDYVDYPSDSIRPTNMTQRIVRAHSHGREWAAAFVFNGLFAVYDGGVLRCTGTLQDTELLRQRVQSPGGELEIAAAAVVTSRELWMLGIALDDRNARFADEYDLTDCRYKRSLRLPVRARTLGIIGNTFVVSYEEPAPAIIGLRPR